MIISKSISMLNWGALQAQHDMAEAHWHMKGEQMNIKFEETRDAFMLIVYITFCVGVLKIQVSLNSTHWFWVAEGYYNILWGQGSRIPISTHQSPSKFSFPVTRGQEHSVRLYMYYKVFNIYFNLGKVGFNVKMTQGKKKF